MSGNRDEDLAPRDKQLNLKVSADCKAVFVAMVKALETTNSDFFEDLVAGRLEDLERQGVKVEV